MLRFFVMLGSAVLAVGGGTVLMESALLGAHAATDLVYLQAIYRALLAIGLLMIALIGGLVVIIIPERPPEVGL
jgi:hypothetical protein